MYSFLHLLDSLVPDLLPVWNDYIGPFHLQKVQLLENCYKKFFEANSIILSTETVSIRSSVSLSFWGNKWSISLQSCPSFWGLLCSISVESKKNKLDSPFHIRFSVVQLWQEYFFHIRALILKWLKFLEP